MSEPALKAPSVIYLTFSYDGQLDETLANVKAVSPFVDDVVVVAPDPLNSQHFSMAQEADLIAAGAKVHHCVWDDSLKAYRDAGLRDVVREKKPDWILWSDPDEAFSQKLLESLRVKIVPQLEKMGLDAAGVMQLERSEDREWPEKLEDLASLAEPPAEARETTWRVKLFKPHPDTEFEGGTPVSKSSPYKSGNLPYHYSFTHTRSTLRLWRNMAMRLVLEPDGANAMRTELLKIFQGLNAGNWPAVERYVTTFHANTTHVYGTPFAEGEERWPPYNPLIEWCERALVWKATDYGLLCRRFSEWLAYHHRDLLEDRKIAEGLLTPPKADPRDEAEDLVARTYLEVLKRAPDPEGKEGYVRLILDGKLPREGLADALRDSAEYRKRFGGGVEKIPVKLPITSVLNLTDEWISSIVLSSRTWKERWQPPLDVGRFLVDELGEPFLRRFYELKARDELTLSSLMGSIAAGVAEKAKPEEKAVKVEA